jgi:hypothetical protein
MFWMRKSAACDELSMPTSCVPSQRSLSLAACADHIIASATTFCYDLPTLFAARA